MSSDVRVGRLTAFVMRVCFWCGRFGDRGLEILAFPCNQFFQNNQQKTQGLIDTYVACGAGRLASGMGGEILESIAHCPSLCVLDRYNVDYIVMREVNVNGSETDPVFSFLKVSFAFAPSPTHGFCEFAIYSVPQARMVQLCCAADQNHQQ